jgi:hypothetical protein
MKRFAALAMTLVLIGTVGWVLVARSAPGTKVITLSAPAFSPRDYSTHNNGTTACTDQVPSEVGGEVRGDMDNGEGSFFHTVQLPQAVKVTKLRLVVNDNDGDADVFAYLARRKIEPGTANTDGYRLMARAKSSGAQAATLRAFNDNTIKAGRRTDNRRFVYFVELVDCGVPEPYSVQIFYERP